MHYTCLFDVLSNKAPSDNPLCVFWDFALQDWSQEGCTFMSRSEDDRITCNCNHLTNFAVIAVSD